MECLRKHVQRFRRFGNENINEALSVKFGTHPCPYLTRNIQRILPEADLGSPVQDL
jgi:hypothetical protein